MENDKIIKLLNDHNLKVTKNRIFIIKCLSGDEHFHSVNDILNHNDNILNTKSIYNTIKVLHEHDVISSIAIDGEVKYVIENKENRQNSTHAFSKKTKKLEHIKINDEVYNSIRNTKSLKGKKIKKISIVISTD